MGKIHTYGEYKCPSDSCDHTSPTKQGLGRHFSATHGMSIREFERKNRDGDFECPTCNIKFDTDRGVKTHHYREHGESIAGVPVECANCGEGMRVKNKRVRNHNRHFCDNDCRFEWRSENFCGENNPAYSSEAVECATCGEETLVNNYRRNRSEKNFCSMRCMGEWAAGANLSHPTGPDNPSWKGGPQPYGKGWNDSKKDSVRERDGHECVHCGISQAMHKEVYGRKLDVHHITPARQIDDPMERNGESNLESVCIPCHRKVESIQPLRPVGSNSATNS